MNIPTILLIPMFTNISYVNLTRIHELFFPIIQLNYEHLSQLMGNGFVHLRTIVTIVFSSKEILTHQEQTSYFKLNNKLKGGRNLLGRR